MLNKTLLSITAIFDTNAIPYMVIGGYAVLYHAHARFTEDIDIVLGIDVDKFSNILELISDDFSPRPENPKQFAEKTNVLPLVEENSGVRVDLIFSFLPFERKAIENSINATVDNKPVNIVRADDLIIYKIMAGRPRDLEDIRHILNQHEHKLDINNIGIQVEELSVALGNNSLIQKWQDIYSDFNN